MLKLRLTRGQVIALAAPMAVLVGIIFWLSTRPETLEGAAQRANDCLMNRDAGCLDHYIWDRERQGLHLDRAKIQRYLTEVFSPNVKGWTAVGQLNIFSAPDQGLLFCSREIRDSRGRAASVGVDVFMTSDGPKINLISSSLFSSFGARFHSDDPELSGPARKNISFLRGLIAEKPLLDGIGIPGFYSSKPGGGLRTWDDFIARTRYVLNYLKVDPAKYETSPPPTS